MNLVLPDFKKRLNSLLQRDNDPLLLKIRESNAPLSNSDEAVVHELISDSVSLLDDLHETCETLSLYYDDLVNFQAAVTDYKRRFEAALAPHRRLPLEVLGEIFLFAVEGEPATFPLSGKDDIRLRLTQVCSRWRRAALATTHLWTDIDICNDDPIQTRILTWWFERTESPMIKLRMQGAKFWKAAFSLLNTPLAERILVLDLFTPEKGDELLDQLTLHSKNLTQLRALSVHVGRVSDTLKLNIAPHLTHLYLDIANGTFGHELVSVIPIPLVCLHLHSECTVDVALDILHQRPTIEDCVLSLSPIDNATLSRLASMNVQTLPNMRKLKIKLSSPDHYTAFLRLLVMPGLRSLLLTGDVLVWNPDFVNLLCNGSFQNLQVLYTGIPMFRPQSHRNRDQEPLADPMRLLRHLPSLQCVHFPPHFPITDDIMEQIGAGHLLPQLRCFHLHSNDLNAVLNAILQRRDAGNPIEFGFICYPKKVRKRQRAKLEDLQLSSSMALVTPFPELRPDWIVILFPSVFPKEDIYLWNVETYSN